MISSHSFSSSENDSFKMLYKSGRKSCEFTSFASTCIKKANVNLSLLQKHLEEVQNKVFIRNKVLQVEQLEENLLKFNETKIKTPKKRLESIEGVLEVFGTEISNPIGHNTNPGISQSDSFTRLASTQKQVVQNVFDLLQRIEEDRTNMEKLLYLEQDRTKSLQEKIDTHARKRIHALREAVQKENTNKKIVEEIEFVKTNSPLIEEKLTQEKESMKMIQMKQDDTDKELTTAKNQLDAIQQKFEQIRQHADHERRMLAARVLSLTNEHNKALEKLLNLQEEHKQMKEYIFYLQNKIAADNLEAESLAKKFTKLEEVEKSLEKQLQEVTSKIFEVAADHKQLQKKNKDLEERKHKQLEDNENMKASLESTIKKRTTELQQLVKSNRTAQTEITHLNRKIEKCKKQRTADAKTIKRVFAEHGVVRADLQVIKEETDQTRMIHEQLLKKLNQEQVKAAEVEEKLTKECNTLKKQKKDEKHARMILQARINADTEKLNKTKEVSEKKKQKLLKTEQEIRTIVETVQAQVEKLKTKYSERLKAVEAVNKLLDQVQNKHKEEEHSLTSRLNELNPREQHLKEKLSEIRKKQQEKEETLNNTNKKLGDMASSSVMMNKLLLSIERDIKELNEELTELQIQLDSGQHLETQLNESMEQIQKRSNNHTEQHALHIKRRKAVLEELTKNLEESLKENRELAIRYTEVQDNHISEKNRFINTYEQAVIAQDSLQDKQTLYDLHSRIHEALKCYYQLRGLQTRAGLSRFEQMAKKSSRKLEMIKKELESSTRNISAFLEANNRSHKLLTLQAMKSSS